ncbi:uncharacterized protein LOC144115531 isoform X8 [Amblyomma americanum]
MAVSVLLHVIVAQEPCCRQHEASYMCTCAHDCKLRDFAPHRPHFSGNNSPPSTARPAGPLTVCHADAEQAPQVALAVGNNMAPEMDKHFSWVAWCPMDLLLAALVSSAAYPSTMMGGLSNV